MSDGASDAYHHIRELADQYLELLVEYFEFGDTPDSASISENIETVAGELARYAGRGWSFADLPEQFCEYLSASLAKRSSPDINLVFFLLFSHGDYSKIIRLQKVSAFKDMLLVFTGKNHHVADNGVFYGSHQEFTDGDQDILLGIAKKRHWREPFMDTPIILVAEKHRYRKDGFILKDVIRFK